MDNLVSCLDKFLLRSEGWRRTCSNLGKIRSKRPGHCELRAFSVSINAGGFGGPTSP